METYLSCPSNYTVKYSLFIFETNIQSFIIDSRLIQCQMNATVNTSSLPAVNVKKTKNY
jgi:hypothetical protein